jgi:sec-independent protein translocase protein TatC
LSVDSPAQSGPDAIPRIRVLPGRSSAIARTPIQVRPGKAGPTFSNDEQAMKRGDADYPDPDDMFADTRMTFGEHIEDLRTHLLRAIYGFLIAFVVALPLGKPVLRFIAAPVEDQLEKFNERYNETRVAELREAMRTGGLENLPPLNLPILVKIDALVEKLRDRLGLPPEPPQKKHVLENMQPGVDALLASLDIDYMVDWKKFDQSEYVELPGRVINPIRFAEEMNRYAKIIRPARLSTLSVQEAFLVLFKVIMMTGLVISSPWVFYQIWAFIAAGLYPSEKRLVNVYLPFSLGLFLVGVFTCEFFVIPKAIEAMLWFNEYLGFQPDLRLSEWLGFAIFMPIVFGVSFQTPLAMYFMERIGLFRVESYKNKRRIAWFLLAIFAAVITPSTDAFSMLFLWVPMCLLYELGIWLCVLYPSARDEEWETSESEEMVEV